MSKQPDTRFPTNAILLAEGPCGTEQLESGAVAIPLWPPHCDEHGWATRWWLCFRVQNQNQGERGIYLWFKHNEAFVQDTIALPPISTMQGVIDLYEVMAERRWPEK